MDQTALFFYNFVERCLENPLRGEFDKEKARKLVPLERFEMEIDKLLAEQTTTTDNQTLERFDRADIMLVKVMKYFKENLFSWVNSLRCDTCDVDCVRNGNSAPSPEESRWKVGSVELYRCVRCSVQYRFPRYNHPEKLMETRRGRCGEWAIAFAFLCQALGYEARLVYITSDHVWVEVWSAAQQRWLHADPCENVLDNPLMYQCGWNKHIDLVIASGIDEIRDVTWRYTARWKETSADRSRKFSEDRLRTILQQTNDRLQQSLSLSQIRRNLLLERWIGELVQFVRTPEQDRIEPGSEAMKGRESGSLQWRLAREETRKEDDRVVGNQFIFNIAHDEKGENRALVNVCVVYDCCLDQYRHIVSHKSTPSTQPVCSTQSLQSTTATTEQVTAGWQSCVFQCDNLFRKLEDDWKMCYLSRQSTSLPAQSGSIRWKFDLSRGEPSINQLTKIEICIRGQVFENGQIRLLLRYQTVDEISQSEPIEFQLNQFLFIDDRNIVHKLKSMELEAKLEGGRGSVAYQHAQLFRQSSLRTVSTAASMFLPNSQFYVNFIYQSV